MNGWIIFIIVFVIIEGSLITIWIHNRDKSDLACQELGFVDYKNQNSMEYCEDIEGNLHYVKMDCKHWYWNDCTAKLISIGDVRVR